ncbi:MAG TPA: hypothetical protein VNC40_05990 [Gaiellaceae bacterium]|nr:hypothetical protein [Gaiellaceae bacterium]
MTSRWLPVLAWAGVIFTRSSIPSLSTGPGGWDVVLRKCAHMTDVGIDAAGALIGLGAWRRLR